MHIKIDGMQQRERDTKKGKAKEVENYRRERNKYRNRD
jgi:hypothetical protein